jgi:hypothetical protein
VAWRASIDSSLKCNSLIVASGHQPGGLADSSRWLKRSENHRNKSAKSCTLKGCESPLRTPLIWHPVGVRSVPPASPVVFASLRPPATILQPFGLADPAALGAGLELNPLAVPKCIPNNASRQAESKTSNTGNPWLWPQQVLRALPCLRLLQPETPQTQQ